MKLSPEIDLGSSLRQVFGNKKEFTAQIERDRDRQTETADAILHRFFGAKHGERREMMLLADEVGLGKTYVALAVAVSMLDAIRRQEAPDGLPANKPVVVVLTPTSDALFNKCRSYAVEGAAHAVSGSTGEGAAHAVSGFASPNRLLRARLLQPRNS